MTYPQASTPDPSVHYSEPVSTAQLAFAASEMEAIGQNLLGGFIRQVVLGFLGAVTGNTLPAFLSQLSAFSNSLQSDISGAQAAINTIIADVGGTVASDVSTAINTAKSDATSAVSELDALISGVSGTAISDVVAVLQMVQQTLDAIANALGQSGSGHSVGEIQAYLGEIPGANIAGALNTAVTLQGQALSSLFNSSGHFIGALDAAATGSLNSAITFGGHALSTVLGGIDSATGDFTGTVTGAVDSAATIAGQAASTVQANAQGALNSIVGGFSSATVTAQQDATSAQAAISDAITGWFNSWAGQNQSAAAASDVASAAAASATAVSAQAGSVSAITQQLPQFYGSAPASGQNVALSISGTLPDGFTATTTGTGIVAAIWGTPAGSDAQSVSGSWSADDGLPNYLFLRGNSTLSTNVYVLLQDNDPTTGAGNCELVAVVAGAVSVFATFALPGAGTLVPGAVYTLSAVGYTYTVSGPGGLSVGYIDSAEVSQVGPSYRYGGFGTAGSVVSSTSFIQPGVSTYTLPASITVGDLVNVVTLGAGGGGCAAYQPYSDGDPLGGGAGQWNGVSLVYGTDIPTSTTSFDVTVGAGGAGGVEPASDGDWLTVGPNPPVLGADGAVSTVAITGYADSPVSASGGTGGGNTGPFEADPPVGVYGLSPGDFVFGGAQYVGGAENTDYESSVGAVGAAGNAPGGGGVVGGAEADGGAGAPGGVWIAAVSTALPGSQNYFGFAAAAQSGPASAFVATAESTSSDTYTQLTTTTDQVTVNIGSSGMALVFINANMGNNGWQSLMGYAISGATTKPASNDRSIAYQNPGTATNNTFTLGAPFLETGLTPGSTTFEAQYCTSTSGFTATFTDRRIAVIPL